METLAANIVEAGEWLPYEVYLVWVKEQTQPRIEQPKASATPETPTMRG
jgi:hypothetical protein